MQTKRKEVVSAPRIDHFFAAIIIQQLAKMQSFCVLCTVCVIFSLISVSLCQEKVELRLYSVPHADKVFLNVTFSNIWHKFAYNEANLVCFQNNNQSMARATRVRFRRDGPRKLFSSSQSYKYKLMVQKEGYVQCNYMPWGKVLASSAVVFIQFGNLHVSAVKLNQNVTVQWLQNTVGSQEFMVRQIAADKSLYHFNAKFYSKEPESDSAILEKLENLLKEKITPPLTVEYVRSTKFCSPLDEYGIPYTKQGGNFSSGGLIFQCKGDFFSGLYWNDEHMSEKLENLFLETTNQTFTNINELRQFSERLKNTSAITVRELPIIANRFEQIVTEGNKILKNGNENRKISNALLVNLDSALSNTSLVSGFAQEVRPNFAARVEDLAETGSAGIMVMENTTDNFKQTVQNLIPFTTEISNEQVIQSSPR